MKGQKNKGKIRVGSFKPENLYNPKKPVQYLEIEVPDGDSVTVGGFLSECEQREGGKSGGLVLRSIVSSSDYTRLIFVKKKDLKNINEEEIRAEYHAEFLKHFDPYAVK